MIWLLDTNVLSNRGDVERNPVLSEWLRRCASRVKVSVVSVAEMQRGLLLLEAKTARIADHALREHHQRRLAQKRAWYAEVTSRFADRMISIDGGVAEKWAETSVRFPSLRDADKAIAATALAHGYGVATENLRHFRHTGLALVNPFDRATWTIEPPDDPVQRLLGRLES